MSSTQLIDCRGQQCPAPILATARAARQLGLEGGVLQILADDDAFPLDLRSWCRSSGAHLLSLSDDHGAHRALVQVGGAPASTRPSGISPSTASAGWLPPPPRSSHPPPSGLGAPDPAASVDPVVLDCRGMECPEPILEVARAARRTLGRELEVLADDDAFELDIASWCRSAKARLVAIERIDGVFRARIRPASAPSVPTASATAAAPPEVPGRAPVALAATSRTADGSTVRLDVGVVPPDRRRAELDRTVRDTHASRLVVIAPDRSFTLELARWCGDGGHDLLSLSGSGPVLAEVQLAAAPEPAAMVLASAAPTALAVARPRRATLLVLHNDKEALLAALLVANGAAAQGMEVILFFTFWGLNLLRGDAPNALHPAEEVSWFQRMFKWMMPRGPRRQALGKLNFGGMGVGIMNWLMRSKNIMDLPDLLGTAQEQGVRFVACTMSMNVMGITKRELHPYPNLEYGGVAAFVENAGASDLSLVF